ncbi:DMT family transporter [Chelatococcus sp. SYSU_G07232]|uniref:DMT family transporter n=1 Tax=Chelatococcus albus TaxID=3047466 RepID=A0ABT7ALJ7_9HYPH|nr:DMT family transporter [Chelatococcus sp. SYSU_G07232]MDJ1159817.1 DMT family transporter [Chelatococcus sp. SYSU_G07232]
MASAADNRRGILAMLAAMACFITNDMLVKLVAGAHATSQIVAIRGVFAVLAALTLAAAFGQLRHLPRVAQPAVGLRALLETGTAFTFITALAHLPLANITAILQGTPLIMTLIVAVSGMEVVGWRRWGAILVGFAGVLVVIRPATSGFDLWSAVAVLAAVLAATRDLVTRRISPEVPSLLVMLATTVAVMVLGFAAGASEGFASWRPIGLREAQLLAGAAVVVSIGNYCIVVACRNSDVALVSSFRYSIIVWATALGYLVGGDLPGLTTIAGTLLIIASGLYTIHRERARARAAVAPLAAVAAPSGEARP